MSRMAESLRRFQAGLDGFQRRLDPALDDAVRRIVTEVYQEARRLVPVDTGNLRNSISVYTDSESAPTRENERWDAHEADDINKIMSHANVRAVIWHIGTSVDYAKFVEFGTSRQAPAGFMRVSMARVKSLIGPIVRDVMKQHGL